MERSRSRRGRILWPAASSFCHGWSGSTWCLGIPIPSPRTVNAQVGHIFAKLAVTGRAEAEAFVVRDMPETLAR